MKLNLIFLFLLFTLFSFQSKAQWFPQNGGNIAEQTAFFLDENFGAAIGPFNIALTIDGGQNYSGIIQFNTIDAWGNQQGEQIRFSDSLHGYISGYRLKSNAQEVLFKSTDGGHSWSHQLFPAGLKFSCMQFVEGTGYMGGEKLLKTLDGNVWDTIMYAPIIDINFFNKDTGFVNQKGEILRTFNGGASWDSIATNTTFSWIRMLSLQNGYAVKDIPNIGAYNFNDELYHTADSGKTWQFVILLDTIFASFGSRNTYDDLLVFTDDSTGYSAGGHNELWSRNTPDLILKTIDGGHTWVKQNTPVINGQLPNWTAICFPTKKVGYAFSDIHGIKYKTTNGGDFGVGITKHLADEMHLTYPNPSNGQFNIELSYPNHDILQISVLDMTGRTIYNQSAEVFEGKTTLPIDLSGRSAGIYFLRISRGSEITVNKIVIQ